MTTPRPITPRHWRALMLTTVAQSHPGTLTIRTATAPLTDFAHPETVTEGEGGVPEGTSDAVAKLIRLVAFDGQLRAGPGACRQGFIPEAMALAGHSEAEVTTDLLPQLGQPGLTGS